MSGIFRGQDSELPRVMLNYRQDSLVFDGSNRHREPARIGEHTKVRPDRRNQEPRSGNANPRPVKDMTVPDASLSSSALSRQP